MSSSTPRSQSTHPMGNDGIVRCHHGEQVQRHISHTLKNPNREFYQCSRPKSEQCQFWYWADDPLFQKSLPGPNMSQTRNANGLSTPEPSPLQQAPAKRKRPESAVPGPRPTQVGAETPSKKARLAAIEAGLQARHRDETPLRAPQFHSAVSEQDDALPFTRGAEATSAFEADTDTGHDVELPARYSFLNLPPSQESQSGAVPSTPKRHPAPSVRAGQELQDLHSEPSSSTLLTPSPSTQSNGAEPYVNVPGGSGSSRLELGTPTRHKGKGRATPRWDQLAATEDNPFDAPSPSFQARLERASADADDLTCAETIGERIAGSITKMRELMDTFDQLDAVRYIQRLERQKNALELREAAKQNHIAVLTKERDELKDRISKLEDRCRKQDKMIATLTGLDSI